MLEPGDAPNASASWNDWRETVSGSKKRSNAILIDPSIGSGLSTPTFEPTIVRYGPRSAPVFASWGTPWSHPPTDATSALKNRPESRPRDALTNEPESEPGTEPRSELEATATDRPLA